MRKYWGKPKIYGQKQQSNNFLPLTGRGMGGGVFDRRPSVSPHNFFFPPPFLFVLFLSSKSPLYTISRGQGMLLFPIPLLMQKAISTIILCYNLSQWLLFSLYRELWMKWLSYLFTSAIVGHSQKKSTIFRILLALFPPPRSGAGNYLLSLPFSPLRPPFQEAWLCSVHQKPGTGPPKKSFSSTPHPPHPLFFCRMHFLEGK